MSVKTAVYWKFGLWFAQHVDRDATGAVLRSITEAHPTYAAASAAAPVLLAEMMGGLGMPVGGAALLGPTGVRERRE